MTTLFKLPLLKIFLFFFCTYTSGKNQFIDKDSTSYWVRYIHSLNLKASDEYHKGQLGKSKNTAFRAYTLAHKYLPKHESAYRDALSNYATFLDSNFNYKLAIEKGLELINLNEFLNTSIEEKAIAYNNLGHTFEKIGDRYNAIKYFKQAVTILQTYPQKKDIEFAKIVINYASCLSRINQLEEAKKNFFLGLNNIKNSFQRDSNKAQQTALYAYQGLAKIGYKQKQPQHMIMSYLQNCLKIEQNYIIQRNSYHTHELLGNFSLKNKDLTNAIKFYNKAIEYRKKEIENKINDIHLARLYTSKAVAYRKLEKYDEALEFHQLALQLSAVDFIPDDVLSNPESSQFTNKLYAVYVLNQKGKTLKKLFKKNNTIDNLVVAFKTFKLASNLMPLIRKKYKEDNSKYRLCNHSVYIYENAIRTAQLLFKKTKDIKYFEAAFQFAESNKSVLLQEEMQVKKVRKHQFLPPKLAHEEQQTAIEINQLERQITSLEIIHKDSLTNENKARLEKWKNALRKKKEHYHHHLNKKIRQYPKFLALKNELPRASLEAIQRKIIKNEKVALVEFFEGKKRIYVFLISENHYKIHSLPKEEDYLNAIKEVLQIVQNPPSEDFHSTYSSFKKNTLWLYLNLLEPILKDVHNSINRLIIIPDGELHNIPFDILLYKNNKQHSYAIDDNAYLLKKYAINYHYSANLFVFNDNIKTRMNKHNFIGFAPSFEQNDQLENLENTIPEVQEIAQVVNGQVIIGEKATKAAFLNNIQSHDIIHIATHAEKDTANIKMNRIYFSDGYLTNYDLDTITINASLVVLNGCETGTGKIMEGEGIMSLSKSFIFSGSSSVLASAWKVDDKASEQIMRSFYNYLNQEVPKDKALQDAKLEYMSAPFENDYRSHPYYWSSFRLIGSSDNISLTNKISYLIYILSPLLFILIFYFLKKAFL